jgi:hypothetical protein
MLPLFAVLACLLAVHAAPAVPQITTATCVLRATSFGGAISGSVDFALNGDSSISITTALTNLTIGDSYRIFVHTFGTWTADGAGAGDRLGLCTSPCRPFAPIASDRSSAGWLANASWLLTDPIAQSASQAFTDNVIQLNGPFSIIVWISLLYLLSCVRSAKPLFSVTYDFLTARLFDRAVQSSCSTLPACEWLSAQLVETTMLRSRMPPFLCPIRLPSRSAPRVVSSAQRPTHLQRPVG